MIKFKRIGIVWLILFLTIYHFSGMNGLFALWSSIILIVIIVIIDQILVRTW